MKLNRVQIFEKLKEIIHNFDSEKYGDLSAVGEGTDLRMGLGLNSVGMLYLIIILEDSFGVRFDTGDVNKFITVGDVVDFIEAASV